MEFVIIMGSLCGHTGAVLEVLTYWVSIINIYLAVPWGSFCLYGLISISAWISNHPLKCGMKQLIHSQTSMFAPLKCGNGWVILSRTLYWMYVQSILGLRLIYVSKRGPGRYKPNLELVNVKLKSKIYIWKHSLRNFPNVNTTRPHWWLVSILSSNGLVP